MEAKNIMADMSRFSDFDEFLNDRKATADALYSARQKRMQTARQQFDTVIKETFNLVKEYHEKIILPRKEIIVVLKKEETANESSSSSPYTFLYRANLIPLDFLPPAFSKTDIMERVDYLTPGKITAHDWHANVALQITTTVEETETKDDIRFHIQMKSWGHITPEETTVLTKNTSFSHEIDKRTPYTIIHINSEGLSEKKLLQEIENLFYLITPAVLSHRETVWKK